MFKPVRHPKVSITTYTDASLEGWGTSMGNRSTGGAWIPDEKLMHINVLEMKAILLALKSFVKTNIQPATSNVEKDQHASAPFVRFFAESKSLSRGALEILSASWRVGTGKRYNSHVERFVKFCRERYTDPIQGTTEMGIEFLTKYFKTGVGYS